MINTHQYLLFCIMYLSVMWIVQYEYGGFDNPDNTEMLTMMGYQEEVIGRSDNAFKDQSAQGNVNQFDPTTGNTLKVGTLMWSFVPFRLLLPATFLNFDRANSNTISKLIFFPLMLLEWFFGIVMIIWFYDKLKNKASSNQ